MSNVIPVVDVFAGCGGLGEGFSALQHCGGFPFDVRLHIEKAAAPLKTLELRSFYHQFRESRVPDSYYEYVSGEIDRDELSRRHRPEYDEARRRCLPFEFGNPKSDADSLNYSIRQAIGGVEDWALIGGPPCQAYSTIGRARNQAVAGYDPDADHRFELYRDYLRIIADHGPAVFVMENVRGLLSASRRNKPIFRDMLNQLGEPGGDSGRRYRLYSLTAGKQYLGDWGRPSDLADFVVKTEDYGIPQSRHRVIILGVREDLTAQPEPLSPATGRVNAKEVLGGLPRVRSGLSRADSPEGWLAALREIGQQPWWGELPPAIQGRIADALENLNLPSDGRGGLHFLSSSSYCGYRPDWFEDARLPGTLNHEARSHRKDDLWRYLYAACFVAESGRPFSIGDFPEDLRPRHRSVESALSKGNFADRFSVLPRRAPAKTVVNHIRKDGHYYIHYDPTQCRSLTVREAARLQTFPDNYFFEGSRTDQYGQVGNAVPPLLSYQIAERVAGLLEKSRNG